MRIATPVTEVLGVDLPIIQAGMSWASSCAALPAAVSAAGGLGVVGAGPMRLADLRRVIAQVRAATDRPFAVNVPLHRAGAAEVLDLLEAERIPVLIASQGGPDAYVRRFQDVGTRCLHVVASERHASRAVAAGVDGLVVVGGEAGGHPPASLVSTLVLVRAVVRAHPSVPIVASGGFADGAGLAAALALGAGAAQFGTRFLLSEESALHPAYKAAVLASGVADTLAVGRDIGLVRLVGNAFARRMAELEGMGADLAWRRAEFEKATLRMAAVDGDVTAGKVEAGQSAGLVDAVSPAGQIVARIAAEYAATVAWLPRPQPPRDGPR
jgi:enoyl-[acyl-carrier protein] reductase II